MAITCVMGFDRVEPRVDNQILNIEAFPFETLGAASRFSVVTETNTILKGRSVFRTYTANTVEGAFSANASDVFHQYKDIRTKWRIGYRWRCESTLGNDTLSSCAGLLFRNMTGTVVGNPLQSNELNYYVANDRYVYIEITIDWENNRFERHIDGYALAPIDIPEAMRNLDDFSIIFASAGGGTYYSRWTDIYFQVDTTALDGGTTPSERLGGAYVRHLTIGEAPLTTGWTISEASTPEDTLNVTLKLSENTRLYPHLISSVAENPIFTYFEPPVTGQDQRVGKGEILFLQTSLNAHRFDGSTAGLYATTVDKEGNEHEERELQLFVDGYDGRAISYLNRTLKNETFTPANIANMGLRLFTRSGGA